MTQAIFEILDKASKLNKKEQVEFLRKNDSPSLRTILTYGLDPTIEWLLPTGDPPFQPANEFESHGALYGQMRKLYLFVRGGNDNLNKIKRETLFIQLLESVHPEDAKVLLAIKEKRLPYDIPIKNINEALGLNFPDKKKTVSKKSKKAA